MKEIDFENLVRLILRMEAKQAKGIGNECELLFVEYWRIKGGRRCEGKHQIQR